LLPLTIGGLILGLAAWWAGNETAATWCWAIPSIVVGIWLAASIIRDLLHGEAGVDLIAVLAIVGALLLGEALAAAGVLKPLLSLGLSDTFIEHGDPARMLADCGLDAAGIEHAVRQRVAPSPHE